MMHGWGLGGIMDSIWEYCGALGGSKMIFSFFL